MIRRAFVLFPLFLFGVFAEASVDLNWPLICTSPDDDVRIERTRQFPEFMTTNEVFCFVGRNFSATVHQGIVVNIVNPAPSGCSWSRGLKDVSAGDRRQIKLTGRQNYRSCTMLRT